MVVSSLMDNVTKDMLSPFSTSHREHSRRLFFIDDTEILLKPVEAFAPPDTLANDDDGGSAQAGPFYLNSNRTKRAGNRFLTVVSPPANDGRGRLHGTP